MLIAPGEDKRFVDFALVNTFAMFTFHAVMKSKEIVFTRTLLTILFLGIVAFSLYIQPRLSIAGISNQEKPFHTGEELNYGISFGVFTIGEGIIRIGKKVHTIQSKPCYKISLLGKTRGLISWIAKVNDQLGAYVDTTSLLTRMAYRKIREGSYEKEEIAVFDHTNSHIKIKEKNKQTNRFGAPKIYDMPRSTYDILSGFLYVRTLDFHSMHQGDTIAFNAFVDDTVYHFQILHQGIDTVSTSLGRVRCVKLMPIMPENKLFNGKDAISCWVSDDKNRIPIKLQANMFIGSFKIRIAHFRGLKHPFNIVL